MQEQPPGTEPLAGNRLPPASQLQESSLTSNIEPEAEISTLNTDLKNYLLNTVPENSIPNTDLQNQILNTVPENSIPNTDLQNQTINTVLENLNNDFKY